MEKEEGSGEYSMSAWVIPCAHLPWSTDIRRRPSGAETKRAGALLRPGMECFSGMTLPFSGSDIFGIGCNGDRVSFDRDPLRSNEHNLSVVPTGNGIADSFMHDKCISDGSTQCFGHAFMIANEQVIRINVDRIHRAASATVLIVPR